MSSFETIDNVAVFHELVDVDLDGRPIMYDESKLQKIVDHNNHLIESGEFPSVIEGHNDGSNNPRSLGHIDRFSLGTRNNKATIFARFQMQEGKGKMLRNEYPKRSIELKHDHLTIPAVALLGSNPALNLGNVFADVAPMKFYSDKTSTNNINTNMEATTEFKEMVLKCLEGTDVWSFYRDLMEKEIEYINEEADSRADDEENETKMEHDANKEGEPEKEESDKMAEKNSNEKDSDMKAEKHTEEKEDEGKDTAKYSALEKENRELRGLLRYHNREKLLIGLATEGYDINVQEELDDTVSLDDETFNKVVGKIKKYSAKAPLHLKAPGDIRTTSDVAPDEKMALKIANHAAKTGCGYEAACKHFNVNP